MRWTPAKSEPFEFVIMNSVASKTRALIEAREPGKDIEKDFRMHVPHEGGSKIYTIEVKMDCKSMLTGNLFLECHNSRSNTPSGLTATKADFWAHWSLKTQTVFVYSPVAMLAYLRARQPKHPERRGVGDNNSDGYLVPIAALKGEAKFISERPCRIDECFFEHYLKQPA